MQFTIPDFIAACPLKDATNPHFDEVNPPFRVWLENWGISTEKKRDILKQVHPELLASHTYPKAGLKQFRTCCDFLHILWVVDEISDEQDGKDARSTAEVFRNVLSDPGWNDKSVLAAMSIDVCDRLLPLARPNFLRRFLENLDDWVDTVAKEAELRESGEILDMQSFTTLRRGCSGTFLCLNLCELALDVDLPDDVFEHPVMQRLFVGASDLVCWSNDVYSYNMEHASEVDGANAITVLMDKKGLDLQAAMDFAGEHWSSVMDQFMEDKARLPSWGPELDVLVANYVEAMGHWVVGSLVWSFVTQRYFGPSHLEVKQTRRVTLRHPVNSL